jgi:natural product precursor
MKKLSTVKKLNLNRETLRQLESDEMGVVIGGITAPACTATCRAACTTITTSCC